MCVSHLRYIGPRKDTRALLCIHSAILLVAVIIYNCNDKSNERERESGQYNVMYISYSPRYIKHEC